MFFLCLDDEIDVKNADETWVQCEKCQKWRRLPANEKAPAEEDFWSCTSEEFPPFFFEFSSSYVVIGADYF